MRKKNLTPQEKLVKAIFGTTEPTKEEIEKAQEKLFEEQAASVTDEEFKRINGYSIQESTENLMLFAGWCNAIIAWKNNHSQERKYHVFDDEPTFTTKQVIDMAQLFYRQGREDALDNTTERNRLWTKNKEKFQILDKNFPK